MSELPALHSARFQKSLKVLCISLHPTVLLLSLSPPIYLYANLLSFYPSVCAAGAARRIMPSAEGKWSVADGSIFPRIPPPSTPTPPVPPPLQPFPTKYAALTTPGMGAAGHSRIG